MNEYLEIPLTTESIIEELSNEEVGKLFQAVFAYVFDNVEPDFSDDSPLKKVFVDFIKQCRKVEERGLMHCTILYEDYEVE